MSSRHQFRMPSSKEKVGQVFTFLAGAGFAHPVDICIRLALLSVVGRDFLLYDRWLAVDTATSMLITEIGIINEISMAGPKPDESRMGEVLKRAGICQLIYDLTGIDICTDESPLDKIIEITNRIRAGEITLSDQLVALLGKAVLMIAEQIYPFIRRGGQEEQEGSEAKFGF